MSERVRNFASEIKTGKPAPRTISSSLRAVAPLRLAQSLHWRLRSAVMINRLGIAQASLALRSAQRSLTYCVKIQVFNQPLVGDLLGCLRETTFEKEGRTHGNHD